MLYDAGSEVGGQFNLAKKVPGKEEFHETLRYFRKQIDLQGVELKLNTRATEEQLLKGGYDEIVLATGVAPRRPDIPGINHPKALGYLDVLRDEKPVGQSVAVIGAGGIGFDVSEYITHLEHGSSRTHESFYAEWGVDTQYRRPGGLRDPEPVRSQREVHLLQRKAEKVGDQLGKTTGWIHRASLKARKVNMSASVQYQKIDDSGLHITVDGVPKSSPLTM